MQNITVLSTCASTNVIPVTPDWVLYGGFLILIYSTIVLFWGLAAICDFYFVPALKILCEELKVPSDVAGATFMAGGASSPEMFVSFLGLFVSKSNIGIGTIIGSEIFNHMCISAGSIYYAKGGVLKLDPWIFSREIFAYLSSIFALIYVLKDNSGPAIASAFDKSTWGECCIVNVGKTVLLLLAYAGYAVIAGNYKKIVKFMKQGFPNTFASDEEVEIYAKEWLDRVRERRELAGVPNPPLEIELGTMNPIQSSALVASSSRSSKPFDPRNSERETDFGIHSNAVSFANTPPTPPSSQAQTSRPVSALPPRPDGQPSTETPARKTVNQRRSVIMTLVPQPLTPKEEEELHEGYQKPINFRDSTLRRGSMYKPGLRNSNFIPNPQALEESAAKPTPKPTEEGEKKKEGHEEEEEENIMSMDHSLVFGFPVWEWFHYMVLPLKVLLYYTNIQMNTPEKRKSYGWTLLSCILWLALLAEAMIEALQLLGYMVGASPLVMGLTFSAAGTSLPNIYSSMIVASQGDGDMAIANCLGSNTFNIYIGLGFPWFVYTLVYGDLNTIQDGGVVVLLLILLWVLVIYYSVVVYSNWELRTWMAYPMIAVYIIVIIYCILET